MSFAYAQRIDERSLSARGDPLSLYEHGFQRYFVPAELGARFDRSSNSAS
jgi:hypothetical protein